MKVYFKIKDTCRNMKVIFKCIDTEKRAFILLYKCVCLLNIIQLRGMFTSLQMPVILRHPLFALLEPCLLNIRSSFICQSFIF